MKWEEALRREKRWTQQGSAKLKIKSIREGCCDSCKWKTSNFGKKWGTKQIMKRTEAADRMPKKIK